MKKKNIDFQTQMKNSEQFLEKLQNIKKTSKDMKDKNKLTAHRNIWVKEYKYLARLERDNELELSQYLEDFDRLLQYQYEDKQVFAGTEFNNYSTLKKSFDEQFEAYSVTVWSQVQSLPILLGKVQKAKKKDVNLQQIQHIMRGIGLFLNEVGEQQEIKVQELNNCIMENGQDRQDVQNDDFEDVVLDIKPVFDQVKGFDFHKERLKQVQEGQKSLIQYLESMTDKLSQDEISEVIQEFHQASTLLHEAMQLQIEKINLDYEDALSLDSQINAMSQNFQKINHFYQIYLGRGKLVAQYYERLSIQFPKVNRKILQRITSYIEAKIYRERKIKTAKRNYLREKEEIFRKVQKEVNLRIQAKIIKAQKQAQALSRRQDKLKLQKQLQTLRADYQQRQNQKTKKLHQQDTLKRDQQRKRQALRKLYLDDLSKKANEFQQTKVKQQKQADQKDRIKREEEQQLAKKRIVDNKPKVNYRQSVEKKKIESKLKEKQFRDNVKILNEERINKAVESYPFRPVVEASEERLNAPTEALLKKKQTKYDKADKIALTRVDGYSFNQLMGDMRFKLNTAFQEAGIANTDYAKDIIRGLSKRPGQ